MRCRYAPEIYGFGTRTSSTAFSASIAGRSTRGARRANLTQNAPLRQSRPSAKQFCALPSSLRAGGNPVRLCTNSGTNPALQLTCKPFSWWETGPDRRDRRGAARPQGWRVLAVSSTDRESARPESPEHSGIGFLQIRAGLGHPVDLRKDFGFVGVVRVHQRLRHSFFPLQRRIQVDELETALLEQGIDLLLLIGGQSQQLDGGGISPPSARGRPPNTRSIGGRPAAGSKGLAPSAGGGAAATAVEAARASRAGRAPGPGCQGAAARPAPPCPWPSITGQPLYVVV